MSDQSKADLAKIVKIRDLQQNSFTTAQLNEAVLEKMKEEARAQGRDDSAVQPPSEKTLRDIRSDVAPKKLLGETQTERRLYVGLDVRNSLCMAAVMRVVVEMEKCPRPKKPLPPLSR